MFGDEKNDDSYDRGESFEEMVRSMAREAGRSIERAIDRIDLDEVADVIGVDPSVAREWFETAGGWLRSHAEDLGEEMASRVPHSKPPARGGDNAWLGAEPHPLDLPTEEQGLALAALASGRWTVEPGTDALAAKGDGPAPSDALGIVRELRVRDWITAGGEITPPGRRALDRWLDAATRR